MKKYLIVLSFLALVLIENPTFAISDSTCGPIALQCICQKLGIAASVEEIVSLSGCTKNGSSLAGLKKAAVAKGLHAKVVRISCDELSALKLPAVVTLWMEHFSAVTAYGEDDVTVVNPPTEREEVVSKDIFQSAYAGYALILSKEPFVLPVTPAGSWLMPDRLLWDAGTRKPGEVVEHIFSLVNNGAKDIVISKIEPSCSCLLIGPLDSYSIAPGEKAELSVIFHTESKSGFTEEKVIIDCNDPITPHLALLVRGVVLPRIVPIAPRSLDFGAVRSNIESLPRTIRLLKGEENNVIEKVESSDPRISAKLDLVDPESDSACYKVEVKIGSGLPLGVFCGNVVVSTNHFQEKMVTIPITANVRSNLDYPPSAYINQLNGRTASQDVAISTADGKTLEISKVGPTPSYLTAKTARVSDTKITVSLTAEGAPPGYSSDIITLHTNDPDEPLVKIKVFTRGGQKTVAAKNDE